MDLLLDLFSSHLHSVDAILIKPLQDPFPDLCLISFYSFPCSVCTTINIFSAVLQTFNLYSSLRILAYTLLSRLLLLDRCIATSFFTLRFLLKDTSPLRSPMMSLFILKDALKRLYPLHKKCFLLTITHFHRLHTTLFFSVVAISVIIICIFTYWNARSGKTRNYLFIPGNMQQLVERKNEGKQD